MEAMPRRFTRLTTKTIKHMIAGGSVGVLPTDTVYGLVARADNQAAVERLYALKRRASQPGTLIAANTDQLAQLGFDPSDLAIAQNYWPNPVSVVLDARNVANYLKHDLTSLAVRIPARDDLRELLEATGPLMTTSANPVKKPTAETIQQAQRYFGDLVDFYIDNGDISGDTASTIVGFAPNGSLIVYRQGIHTP